MKAFIVLKEGVKHWSAQPLPRDFYPGDKLIVVETVCCGQALRFAGPCAPGYEPGKVQQLDRLITNAYREHRLKMENPTWTTPQENA